MKAISFLLLDAAPAPQGAAGAGSPWTTLIFLVVLMVIFWLFFIRPQAKKQKEMQRRRDALKVGDKVLSSGGIYGTIREVGDTYFMIEIAKDVKVRIDKNSVFESKEN